MVMKNDLLKVVRVPFETAGIKIAVLNTEEAKDRDLKHLDRILVKYGKKKVICSIDLTRTTIKKGEIGLFVEPWDALGLVRGKKVSIEGVPKPASFDFIRAKLEGEELNEEELRAIVNDIVHDALNDVELTAFITASYCEGLSMEETYYLTKAMVDTGERLNIGDGPVFDKHSIGGVPGNRVTMVMIPIVSSAGLKIPKTSSRAITSPAGTADTMEVFAPVTLSKRKIENIVRKVGGCMVWGGSFNLAPADDKIIKVEKPLSIDPEGQLLASIMAKKISVGSTHIVIDLPMGPGTKVPSHEDAADLVESFTRLGEKLGVKVYAIESNGSQPCGNGVGPALEARDVLKVLTNDESAPKDFIEKCILFSGFMLEIAGKAAVGKGSEMAREILASGKAYEQFKRIVKAQGGDPDVKLEDIKVGEYTFDVLAENPGIVSLINNKALSSCARAAGAPYNKGAGVFVKAKLSDSVVKGDLLMRIHAESKEKLDRARKVLQLRRIFTIQ
ncbi:MAG: AMP phosphorylase [Nanoarchaeota archaeon]|nr:AMP phosphorylase [Nanoarchaeota archaeon]